jgi:DNA-binding transcriptional ArsR family regulator
MNKLKLEAKVFKILAHPVRLQILEALANQPLCVCELVALTGRRQAYISQHLALLREVNLVRYERSGLNIYYRVNAGRVVEISEIFRRLKSNSTADQSLSGDDESLWRH